MQHIDLEPIDLADLVATTGGQVRAPAYANQPIVWRNGYASEQPRVGPTFPSERYYRTNPYLNPSTQYFNVRQPSWVWRR